MKRLLLTILAVLIVGAVTIASAAYPPVRANIPFAFHVGDAVLPAGEYKITVGGPATLGSNIFIERQDGPESCFVSSTLNETTLFDDNHRLTFTRYGDAYFLSKVKVGATEVVTSKGRAEKRMAGIQGTKAPVVATLMK